jgi:hypothetical protein
MSGAGLRSALKGTIAQDIAMIAVLRRKWPHSPAEFSFSKTR